MLGIKFPIKIPVVPCKYHANPCCIGIKSAPPGLFTTIIAEPTSITSWSTLQFYPIRSRKFSRS